MRVPQLRKHATGQWFARWGGKDHYFGKDRSAAKILYDRSIEAWASWRAQKNEDRRERRAQQLYTINDIAEQFLSAKRLENGGDCEARYERHLHRFRAIFGHIDCTALKPKHLQLPKTKMIERGYKPRTVNHDIGTIKTMYNWALALDLAPPISLVGVKEVPCGPVDNPSLDWSELLSGFRNAPDYLQPWIALNYLALLRPTETIKVFLRQGTWLKQVPGVFVLDRGKMDTRAAMRRHCVLSPRAMAWLQQAEPRYRRLDSYSQAVRDHCDFGPKAIQKTAASRLILRHRVLPDDVDLLLGHIKSRLSVTYFATLRSPASDGEPPRDSLMPCWRSSASNSRRLSGWARNQRANSSGVTGFIAILVTLNLVELLLQHTLIETRRTPQIRIF